MDDADLAQEHLERFEKATLARRKPVLPAVGACHYCGEALSPGLLFCDKDCAASYEEERQIKERQGLA